NVALARSLDHRLKSAAHVAFDLGAPALLEFSEVVAVEGGELQRNEAKKTRHRQTADVRPALDGRSHRQRKTDDRGDDDRDVDSAEAKIGGCIDPVVGHL